MGMGATLHTKLVSARHGGWLTIKLPWWPAACTNYLWETGHLVPKTCLEYCRHILLLFWSPNLTCRFHVKESKTGTELFDFSLLINSSQTVSWSPWRPQQSHTPVFLSHPHLSPLKQTQVLWWLFSIASTSEPQKGISKCCHCTWFPKLMKSPYWKTDSF